MTTKLPQWRLYRLAMTILLACCAMLCPPQAAAQDKPVVLARLKGMTITFDDVAQRAYESQRLNDEPYVDDALCKRLLDNVIYDSLVSLAARNIDVNDDYGFRGRLRMDEVYAALMAYQSVDLIPNLVIDSVAVDSFYQANVARYTAPRDQRKIRQITVYNKKSQIPKSYVSYVDPIYEGWDPKRKVDSIYTRLANGEDFTTLAKTHSEELKAKMNFGELGWISRLSVADSELVEPFFSMPLHMISRPLETSYGWVIAQATEERKAGPAPIDAFIRADIMRQLREDRGRKAATALTDSLVAAGTVEFNDSLLDAPDTMIDEADVMAVVNQRDTLWGAEYKFRKNQDPRLATQPSLSREQKEELLQKAVRLLSLYGAMREWGYLDDSTIVSMCARRRFSYAREKVHLQFSTSTYTPDSAAIAKYYHDHIADFTPERRHQVEIARVIDRDSAQQIMAAWRAGTRPEKARVQVVGPSDLPAPVWNKLAAVTPNSFVGPIGANGVYWILHLNRIEPPRPLKDVRGAIGAAMRQQEQDRLKKQWIESASRRYGLVRYDERLKGLQLPSRKDPRFVYDTLPASS